MAVPAPPPDHAEADGDADRASSDRQAPSDRRASSDRQAPSDRRASWLEVFFDLVFVLAVAQLDRGLIRHPDLAGAATFVGLFVPVWWAWVGFVFFLSRFDHDDVPARLSLLVAMLGTMVMAAQVPGAFSGRTAGLALAYGAVRLVLVGMYARGAMRAEPDERSVATVLGGAFALSAVIWLASALVPAPARYALWAAGLVLDLGAPVGFGARLARAPIDPAHLPERFGLFVIIVLGEGVVAIGTSVGPLSSATAIVCAVAGFVLISGIWWTYFDRAAFALRDAIGRRDAIGLAARDVYSYGHFPIVCGIVAQAAGIELLIIGAARGQVAGSALWLVSGGTAAYLLGLSGIQLALTRDLRAPVLWVRVGVSLALLALALLAAAWDPGAFVLGAAMLVVVLAVFGALRPPSELPEPAGRL